MDGTPRLRSAFPATPSTDRRSRARFAPAPRLHQAAETLPDIPALHKSTYTASPPGEPLIPEHIIDAPSQRLYAFAFWAALWCWKFYDLSCLHESEEQSLWLFMKWVALDGVWLFGLPGFRIPWLEWSSSTMLLLFLGHAFTDAMMMFRIPIPITAGFAALGRSLWGAYEVAINERNVNPRAIEFNESVILGRQIIHILPEGSAVLNPQRQAFCIDGAGRTEARLPITINATNPISMDVVRIDLETQANETVHISKSQLKSMHKEASRLVTYGHGVNEPKTLYLSVKKPGLYALAKVIDESNLEVSRKQMAHTVVVPCPKANILPTTSDRCRGDVSNIDMEVTGTPPMRVKYRKRVNQQAQEATFESIQPDDFVSPLANADRQTALTIPRVMDTAWAKPHTVRVPLSEGMGTAGKWSYSLAEIEDGLGNKVTYSDREHEHQERSGARSGQLHQVITIHERPTVQMHGCTPQQPMKVAKGSAAHLPIQLGSSGRGAIADSPYHINYLFSPQEDISATGEHDAVGKPLRMTLKGKEQKMAIHEPGLYTITGVSTDFCRGEVFEPSSCLLQNPPEPQLNIATEEISDKCAGSPIGLRVDLDLLGTPPFEIRYRMVKKGDRHHQEDVERVNGLRGQMDLTPRTAGQYEYIFLSISDAVYKDRPLKDRKLSQHVKPAASAGFAQQSSRQVVCVDESATLDVGLQGDQPFTLEYELVHNGKRQRYTITDIQSQRVQIETEALRDGGDYTVALVSVTDETGCKELLKDEAKISVRHQKPKVSFGAIDGRHSVETLEGRPVAIPLRMAGEAPWTVTYLDQDKKAHSVTVNIPNDRIQTTHKGLYQLVDVRDAYCPGQVDDSAKTFEIDWIARPELRIAPSDTAELQGRTVKKSDVCEGDDDSVDILFKGIPPYLATYTEKITPDKGAIAPKQKELRAALHVATLRMDTSVPGTYAYTFDRLKDQNYDHDPRHFAPWTVKQRVHPRPSVAFVNPGKTYSYCSVESADGEEVIPIQLQGAPPFDVEVEIRHHGTGRPETLSLTGIPGHTHNIRVPHSRVHLGKSAIQLRRVSDSRGCTRILDSTTPRVQIAVFDAPSITPLENHEDFCVGQHVNFALSGVAPFEVFYTFEGQTRKAKTSSSTFRRLAEKPGTFVVTGVQDSASSCKAATHIERRIHGMPSVRVSRGKESYVDIHEGGEAEILFEFGGVPPFEFTYTRSSNTERGGRKKGVVLDVRHEVSEEFSLSVKAGEEGTYEVIGIRDRWCSYTKPGVELGGRGAEGKKRIAN